MCLRNGLTAMVAGTGNNDGQGSQRNKGGLVGRDVFIESRVLAVQLLGTFYYRVL